MKKGRCSALFSLSYVTIFVQILCFIPTFGQKSFSFDELYNALFNKADRYISIVKFLSSKREGFTRSEIEQRTGYAGGGLSKMLDNLERCDFIVSYAQFGNKSKQTLYRLSDFYTLFYFRFVESNKSRDEHYWQHHFADRNVEAWEGFTFEEVCLRHLPQIKQGLGIAGMATEASSWRFVPQKDDERKGAQIDLVIKRADKIIHLVEMKFSETPFVITKDYEQRLRERKTFSWRLRAFHADQCLPSSPQWDSRKEHIRPSFTAN